MTWTVDEQLALTATEAVAAIQSGRLNAADYVATLLARAAALSSLNALTALDLDGALAAARRIDALPAAEKARLPLAGLAIVVKDNINTAGMQTSAGTPALEGFIPKTNAPSVQRLIDAGAIVLGKANMHELAFGITSTNLATHAGPVRNPYDPVLIPRWLVGRHRRGDCRSHRARGSRHRHRRLDSHSGRVDGHGGVSSVSRQRRRRTALSRSRRRGADQPYARHRRADGTHRRRYRAARRRDHRCRRIANRRVERLAHRLARAAVGRTRTRWKTSHGPR